jgi:hypothetical protein
MAADARFAELSSYRAFPHIAHKESFPENAIRGRQPSGELPGGIATAAGLRIHFLWNSGRVFGALVLPGSFGCCSSSSRNTVWNMCSPSQESILLAAGVLRFT